MVTRKKEQQDVLTLIEAAELLRVSEKTLWVMVRASEVPHRRVGKQYRFSRAQLIEWLESAETV